MDHDRRRYLFNRCKPGDALRPDDDRYIDLDARRVRGIDWVARLAARIELSDEPTCQLFTGLPGSGKSTELLRLARRLERREGANLLAVVVAADDMLDLLGPIDVPDIVLVIVAACERALLEAEGKDPEIAMESGYFARLWNWLTQTDATFNRAEFAIGKVGKLTAELRTRPNLRQRFRETVGVHLNQFLAELFGANTEARVEQLIEWSGGYPRELVRLLHDSLLSETIPLSDADFRRLLNEVGDQYRKLIPADAFPWLARVAIGRYLTLDTEEQRQTADAMLSNNVVLRYVNDRDWFDLHPSVRQIPGVALEIERLLASASP